MEQPLEGTIPRVPDDPCLAGVEQSNGQARLVQPSEAILPTLAGVDPSKLFDYGQRWPDVGQRPFGVLGPMEHCGVKSIVSLVMGGGMGFVFGIFMGSFDNSQSLDPRLASMSTKEQMVHSYRTMATKSKSMGKNFAKVGFMYSGIECCIEKARGKHDMTNAIGAGCLTGGLLAARAGPGATVLGCGGFAAFSAAIEMYMGH
mmetsp:Transcript_9656/g.10919  ORF Transcript_9656/g.10919 Transcript_9656/m.10919 type:complete len:202 (-) Transcript_9656:137-742(-)